jgi:hypothetical protein
VGALESAPITCFLCWLCLALTNVRTPPPPPPPPRVCSRRLQLEDEAKKEKERKRRKLYDAKKAKKKEQWTWELRQKTGVFGFEALYKVQIVVWLTHCTS